MMSLKRKELSVILLSVFNFGLSSSQNNVKSDEAHNMDAPFDRRLDICDENIFLNSDGNSANGSLDLWEGKRCTIISVNDGYQPGSKAIKATNRRDVSAGPAQQFSREQLDCLNEGDTMTISVMLRLEDENGRPFVCNGSTWNLPSTCPMVSLWVEPSDNPIPWSNHWNEANLAESGGWQAEEWNLFTSTFDITSDMANADSIYFTVRGAATNIDIFMSDPIFTFAVPSLAPSIPLDIINTAPTFSPTTNGNGGANIDNNGGATGGSSGSTSITNGNSSGTQDENSNDSSSDNSNDNANNGSTSGSSNDGTTENSNDNGNESANDSTNGSSNDNNNENSNSNGSTNGGMNNSSNQNSAGNIGNPNQNNSGRPIHPDLNFYLRKRSRIRSRTFRSYAN